MKETPPHDIESWISIGDAIEMGEKKIYLVAKVTIIKWRKVILGCWISPLSLLVTEPGFVYAISLTGEEMTIDTLLAMAPSLKRIVGKANVDEI